MLTHEEMVCKMLKDPEVKAEYDALEPEFELLDELIDGSATPSGVDPFPSVFRGCRPTASTPG